MAGHHGLRAEVGWWAYPLLRKPVNRGLVPVMGLVFESGVMARASLPERNQVSTQRSRGAKQSVTSSWVSQGRARRCRSRATPGDAGAGCSRCARARARRLRLSGKHFRGESFHRPSGPNQLIVAGRAEANALR